MMTHSHNNMGSGMGQHHGGMGMMGSSSGMMDQLKNNIMTMLMFKNMNQLGTKSGESSTQDMFYMVYVFIITQLVDLFIKYLPMMIATVQTHFMKKIENPIKQISRVAEDITDATHKVKPKSASIAINIGVSDHENVIGQALLDHITNHDNTKHIKYVKQTFILNEQEVICIEDDIFVIMTKCETESTQEEKLSQPKAVLIQSFEVFSFVKTTKELREFLFKLRHEYIIATQNKLGTKRFFFNMKGIPAQIRPGPKNEQIRDYSRLPPYFAFTMKEFQTNRKFSNLFGDEIDVIRQRVQFFMKNRKWYDEKGVPYTLGLLLSGDPGTGKTSCIKCLANETNRHIVNINLNNDITKTQLENLFFNESLVILNPYTGQNEKYNIPLDKRIYVLEDVDCQGDAALDRDRATNVYNQFMQSEPEPKSFLGSGGSNIGFGSLLGPGAQLSNQLPAQQDIGTDKSDKMDMSFLLNLLDGVLETPGRILIMTSNYPDTLDRALIRPGRIDIISKFRKCRNKTVVDMMEFFYNIQLSALQKKNIYQLPEETLTPAELSKIMYEHFGQPDSAIEYLANQNRLKHSRIIDTELDLTDETNETNETDNTDDSDKSTETNGYLHWKMVNNKSAKPETKSEN